MTSQPNQWQQILQCKMIHMQKEFLIDTYFSDICLVVEIVCKLLNNNNNNNNLEHIQTVLI